MPSRAEPAGRGELALLACALIWGATFPLIDQALVHASPLTLNAVRFTLAAVVLAPRFLPRDLRVPAPALGAGAILGAVLAAAYALQTWALPEVGPSRSAFLTAFYVIFTPLLDWIFSRRFPGGRVLAGALLAFAGAALMSGGSAGSLGLADLLTLACALGFATHISLLSWALRRADGGTLLFLQIAGCALFSWAFAPLVETPRFEPRPSLVAIVVFLSVAATVLAIGLQTYGQARASAPRAAILFASEPVWAALLSALLGERLARGEIAGAAFVLAGILVTSLPPRRLSGGRSQRT